LLFALFQLHEQFADRRYGWPHRHEADSIVWPIVSSFLVGERAPELHRLIVERVFLEGVMRGDPNVRSPTRRSFYRCLTAYRLIWIVELALAFWVIAALGLNAYVATSFASVSPQPARLIPSLAIAVAAWIAAGVIGRKLRERLSALTASQVRALLNAPDVDYRQRVTGVVRKTQGPLGQNASAKGEAPRTVPSTELATAGQLECAIAESLMGARASVLFLYPERLDRLWLFHVLPAFLFCRKRGVSVHLVTANPEGSRQGLRYLQWIGCTVKYGERSSQLPESTFGGLIVDRGHKSIRSISFAIGAVRASLLEGDLARSLATSVGDRYDLDQKSVQLPKLRVLPEHVLIERLKTRVVDYSGCPMQVKPIDVVRTRPMTRFVRKVADDQWAALKDLYVKSGVPPFSPAVVELTTGKFSPVLPPVVEEQEDGTYRVHEGHTRVYRAWREAKAGGGREIPAVVVQNALVPPGHEGPYTWDDPEHPIQIASDPVFENPEVVHNRGIEEHVRLTAHAVGKQKQFDMISESELDGP